MGTFVQRRFWWPQRLPLNLSLEEAMACVQQGLSRDWAAVVEQTHVVFGGVLIEIQLDAEGHEAKNGTSPQQEGEAAE